MAFVIVTHLSPDRASLPHQVVDRSGLAVTENNPTVQIAALRRILAEHKSAESWMQTLPRLWYRYAGPAVTRLHNRPAGWVTATDQPDRASGDTLATPWDRYCPCPGLM